MGRATSGVTGMKFQSDADSVLSMSVIRAAAGGGRGGRGAQRERRRRRRATTEQVADVKAQYVFTITDALRQAHPDRGTGGITGRGGLGVKAMTLANEDRGGWLGAFIVEEGDEVLSITQSGQVVRSPINADFRPTGRSHPGCVRFVTPKAKDAVAVVARSVEAKVSEEADEIADEAGARTAPTRPSSWAPRPWSAGADVTPGTESSDADGAQQSIGPARATSPGMRTHDGPFGGTNRLAACPGGRPRH